MSKKLELGINHVTNREYHSDKEYLSSSDLKTLLDSPAKFYDEKILGNRENKESPAFDEGSYIHSLILEPHLVNAEFAFFEGMRKAGQDWEKFKEDNAGKIILSAPQKERCKYYFESYQKLPAARALISDGMSEHTICQELNGVKIKVRCDYINVDKGYIVDVKTSSFPVDRDSFKITIDQYRYQLSAALYSMVAAQYYGKPFTFYFIAISKKETDCQVLKISEATMRRGQQMVKDALDIYKKCKDTGIWETPKKDLIFSGDYEILEV